MPAVGQNTPDRSYLSIREVLELLVKEFPDVTISKIRFLESRGLIHPERTPSGYRKFYEADVERLRWILLQQRENFLPLKVIKGRLDQTGSFTAELPNKPSLFDSEADEIGEATDGQLEEVVPEHSLGGRGSDEPPRPPEDGDVTDVVTEPAPVDEEVAAEQAPEPGAVVEEPAVESPAPAVVQRDAVLNDGTFSLGELIGASGASQELIASLVEFGLIESKVIAGVVCFDGHGLEVARLASGFARFGIEPRHLRSLKHAAERQAGMYAQVVTPLLRQRNPEARERARDDLTFLADLGSRLQSLFVDATLRELGGR